MRDDRAQTVEIEIPASLREAVDAKLALATEERVAERLEAGDATLWAPAGTPEVADRLGWLTIAQRMLDELGAIELFAAETRDGGIKDVVLLGMGGSSLAPEVLRRCFDQDVSNATHEVRLHVLDSTDAATIRAVQEEVELEQTLFVVSSKSGGTIEPLSLFAHFWSLVPDGAAFVAITDPGTGLEALAEEHGFRRVFAGDKEIGGRYSALSAFGVVPGALYGVDVHGLLAGASAADHREAVRIGATLSALAEAGRDKLTFLIDQTLPGLGLWLEQLVAESTGKHGKGVLPVAEEPPGTDEEYGEDRAFMCITGDDGGGAGDSTKEGVRAHAHARAQGGHPVITIPTSGRADLGKVFMLAELAVAVVGWGLKINPFDQPDVQKAKDATKGVLAKYEESGGALPELNDADEAALGALLAGAAPPSYVAIMGYVQPAPEFDAAVSELRATIRSATKATTTFGYGPRFLHSTGQFHKGGPKTGRFLQLLHDGPADVEIPGGGYTFTTLKNAQAIGDWQTLRGLGLPVERVRLKGPDPAGAVRELTAQIKEMLS